MLVLVLVCGLVLADAAKAQPKKGMNKNEKRVNITPGTCAVDKPKVTLYQHLNEFVTWNLTGAGTDKHTVKFDKPKGTPCDSGLVSFDMNSGGAQTTACTVQKVLNAPKTYNYSIYKMVGNQPKKCADPSVVVDP